MTTSATRILASDTFWRLVAGVIGLAGVGYFYRYFFTSGFSRFQGDYGDGRLVPLISAHWANPFDFSGNWRNLEVFYPVDEALSHSDTLLISGIITAPFEWLNINTFLSFQIFLISLSISSYIFFIKFMREKFTTPWLIAITFSFVFTFSNGLLVSSNHPQLLYYLLIPIILYYGHKIIIKNNYFTIKSILLGIFIGFVTLSTFYIGFYLILSAVLFSIFLSLQLLLSKKTNEIFFIWRFYRNIILGGIIVIPFFILTYIPMIQKNATRSFEMILDFALRPTELFNLSNSNLLWGSTLNKYLSQQIRSDNGEFSMAPTWILVLTSFLILFYLIIHIRFLDNQQRISLSLILTALLLWIAPVNFANFFLWEYMYLIPGVDVIRTVGRVHIFVGGLLSIAVSIFLANYWNNHLSKNISIITFIIPLLALIALEQINKLPQQNNFLSRDTIIDEIVAAPTECKSFLIIKPLSATDPNWTAQMDAMVLAKKLNIPTWNGYSGNPPDQWSLFNLNDENYLANASEWRNLHDIKNGCGINLEENNWLTQKELNLLLTR